MEPSQLKPPPEFAPAATPEGAAPFRVLSLDGGGYKGMFSAAILDRLVADLGIDLLSSFDLLAGTSTGAIIALGLAAGLTPQSCWTSTSIAAPRSSRRVERGRPDDSCIASTAPLRSQTPWRRSSVSARSPKAGSLC